MTATEIIARLEELWKEPTSPIEFARRSADTFNAWAEENPAELELLVKDHAEWSKEYAHRVHERMKDIPWDLIWSRTTQAPEAPPAPPIPESK